MIRRPLLPLLLDRLRKTTEAGAIATLLGAILPRLADLPPAKHGHPGVAHRTAALDLDTDIGPFLDASGRCGTGAVCPACRTDAPCPLDVWRLSLAPVVLGTAKQRAAFLKTTGVESGTGPYMTMRRKHRALADAAIRLLVRTKIEEKQHDVAHAITWLAFDAGCQDPEITEAQAITIAAPGRAVDLEAGKAICERILPLENDNTDDAWRSLAIRHANLAGRLARLRASYEDVLDERGQIVIERRHHPKNPVRSRPLRFHPISASEAPPETIAPAPLRWRRRQDILAAKTERLSSRAAASGPTPSD